AASAASVRLIPSGVTSNAHAMISAIGKPMMINKTTNRIAQFGTSKTGRTCAMPCESAHPPTMYATATLYTLRRFNSEKKEGFSLMVPDWPATGRRVFGTRQRNAGRRDIRKEKGLSRVVSGRNRGRHKQCRATGTSHQ